MDKKGYEKVGIAFLIVFLMAIFSDIGQLISNPQEQIVRSESGGEDYDIPLILNVEGVLEDYPYTLEVAAQKITEEKADKYFQMAKEVIDADIAGTWEDVPIKEDYLNGWVEAEWSFSPMGSVSENGELVYANIPKDGMILAANVRLYCGEYQQIYSFAFPVSRNRIPLEKRILNEIDEAIFRQYKEGEDQVQLPNEILGYSMNWSVQKEFITGKICLIELAAFLLLIYSEKQRKTREEKKYKESAEAEYCDILMQLLVMLESGMTIRQVWMRITEQYIQKREKALIQKKDVYEELVCMNRMLQEGESERAAYEAFMSRINVVCYRKLMRTLLNNTEKGNRDICLQLSEEAGKAYEQRILFAKRLGEEASTKMLLPLMIMMILVMGIVMLPALIELSY